MGAACSLATVIVVGVSSSRLSLISTGTNMINRVSIYGDNLYSQYGVFNYDINLPSTLQITNYDYFGPECNATGQMVIPPIDTCQSIPDCTLCISNLNYQRCDGRTRMMYDVVLLISIIAIIYLSLWILIPILSLILALVKPSGSNGLFRRYMIYAALISGDLVKAQCDVTGPAADPVPVSKISDGLEFTLETTSECASFRYIDDQNDFRNIEICYARYMFQSLHAPVYDFATSISTTSTAWTDWEDSPNTFTSYTFLPNGNVNGNMTGTGDVGSLYVMNNDICCAKQQCRSNQMCLDEQSVLEVNGVATMTLPTYWTGTTYVSIKEQKEGNNATMTCAVISGPGAYVYDKNGIKITLTTDNQFSDQSKQYDLAESTLIYDRFSVMGAKSMYVGDYPTYITQPYDDQCDESPSRPINRTVLVNSCGDLNTYGLIDNRIIYSRLKKLMYYSLYIMLPGSTGARTATYSQLKTEFSTQDDVNAISSYLNSGTISIPIGSYVLLDGTATSAQNVNSVWDVRSLIISATSLYWTEDFIRYYSSNIFAFACNHYTCNMPGWSSTSSQSCIIGSPNTAVTQTYNVMHTLYGGAVKTNIYEECNARYVEFVDQFEYNACIMELTAMTACLSPPILYGSLNTFAICLYSVTQIDYMAIAMGMSFPFNTDKDCANCKSDVQGKYFVSSQVSQNDMAIRTAALVDWTLPCSKGQLPGITYPQGFAAGQAYGQFEYSFEAYYNDGWLAATMLSMVGDIMSNALSSYADGNGKDCRNDVTPPCSMRALARAFTQCASTCYAPLSFPATTSPGPPATSATNLYFTDDTAPGCALTPTNIRAETKLKCSFYPEYRWQYTEAGTPQTVGMIPPTIIQSSCNAPVSDGCWASLGIGIGQQDGTVQTLIFSGNMPPNTNSVDQIYDNLEIEYMQADVIRFTQSEFYGSGNYINSPFLNIEIESKNVITEESAGYATYLNIQTASYVTGDVNDAVTFILKASYQQGGVIAFANTQTGSSNMDQQYCFIDTNFNCTLFAICTDTPCTITINAVDTNTSINTYLVAVFNVPEACRDCNQGSQTSQQDVDKVGEGCFLICWNFSGLGGFIGALVEWAIIIFVILIGLSLVCMIPKIYNDIRPKRA